MTTGLLFRTLGLAVLLALTAVARAAPPVDAAARLQAWHHLLAALEGRPQPVQLAAVNRFFNSLAQRDDRSNWGRRDYWTTPRELLARGSGDCEDFAIAKFYTLRRLGIADADLHIMAVKVFNRGSGRIEAHMVLAYGPATDPAPLILDNLTDRIDSLSQRADLEPAYAFNEEGLWAWDGRGHRTRLGNADLLGKWRDLQARVGRDDFRLAALSPGL